MCSMPSRSDESATLSCSRLCEIAGVNRQTRDQWALADLLRKASDYEELDLVETVVLKLLLDTLPKRHAKIAWPLVRPALRQVVPGPNLTLVWDPARRSAELALDVDTIALLVRHGRPVQVLDVGSAVTRAREAFRRDVEASHGSKQTARAGRRAARSRA
jgi:hypothetical protein